MELISIVVPVYNVEPYLERCLESLINQTYRNIEILLIDDGSTDQSGRICDKYACSDPRIIVHHEKNCGVSASRNKGILKAQGTWIFFMDSDDWVDTRLIQICHENIRIHPLADICFIGYKEVDSLTTSFNRNTQYMVKRIFKKDFTALQEKIFNRDRKSVCDPKLIKLSSPCKLYRKSFLEQYRLRFPEKLTDGEDGVFNLYAYEYAREGICIEKILYYYYRHEGSVTQKYTEHAERDFHRLHEAYLDFFKETGRSEFFKSAFQERLIWSFSFCCILKYCHPKSPYSYGERRMQFLAEYIGSYESLLKGLTYKNFKLKKKLLFFFIQRKCFFVVNFLCAIQNKSKRKHLESDLESNGTC